jgi:hypothetical protein
MNILHIVLYWYEIWSLTLREEHRFRASENRLLIRIFGPERKEIRGQRQQNNK